MIKQYRDTDYYVDEEGEVYSTRRGKMRRLAHKHNQTGIRIQVILSDDGRTTTTVRRMVWTAFRGEIPQGYCVQSPCKTDVCLNTLYLVPYNEIQKKKRSKKVISYTLNRVWQNAGECGDDLGYCRASISYACEKKYISKNLAYYQLEYYE